MGINVSVADGRAICPADSSDIKKSITDSSDSGDRSRWFVPLAKKLWPSKTAAAIEFLTGARERQCYRYASGAQEPPSTLIVDLLRSEDGARVLNEILRGSKSKWVRDFRRAQAALPLLDQWKQLDLAVD
jgi:hypothetical protein